jgi:hypothetical protein
MLFAHHAENDLKNDPNRLSYLRSIVSHNAYQMENLWAALFRLHYQVSTCNPCWDSGLRIAQASPDWIRGRFHRYLQRTQLNNKSCWVFEGTRPWDSRDSGDAQVIAAVSCLLIWSGCIDLQQRYEGVTASDASLLWKMCCESDKEYLDSRGGQI